VLVSWIVLLLCETSCLVLVSWIVLLLCETSCLVPMSWIVLLLCETSWQLTMNGQAQFKHARERGGGGGWTRIKSRVRRRKRRSIFFLKNIIVGWKVELAGIYNCCIFFFRYANDYIMISFMFWLGLGFLKG